MLLCQGKVLPCKDEVWGGPFSALYFFSLMQHTRVFSAKAWLALATTTEVWQRGASLVALDARDHIANYICTKGNILGDSWTCCQAPGPLLSLHPPNGGLECGLLVAGVPGTQPLAAGILPLPKPFFPLCPGKAAPSRYLFAGPFPLQT